VEALAFHVITLVLPKQVLLELDSIVCHAVLASTASSAFDLTWIIWDPAAGASSTATTAAREACETPTQHNTNDKLFAIFVF